MEVGAETLRAGAGLALVAAEGAGGGGLGVTGELRKLEDADRDLGGGGGIFFGFCPSKPLAGLGLGTSTLGEGAGGVGVKPIWRSTPLSTGVFTPLTEGAGVCGLETADIRVAGTDEVGVGRGIIGLVGECEGVPSCSSSTSIKFGAPFDRTGSSTTEA